MKNIIRKLIALFISVFIIAEPLTAVAEKESSLFIPYNPEKDKIVEEGVISGYFVNPWYVDDSYDPEKDFSSGQKRGSSSSSTKDSVKTYTDREELINDIAELCTLHQSSLSVNYICYVDNLENELKSVAKEAIASTDDYSRLSVKSHGYRGSHYIRTDSEGQTYFDATIEFVIRYNCTLEQEMIFEEELGTLMETLDLESLSPVEQIKGVYDYITENVEYDSETPENETLQYTAYKALIQKTAVCQGISLLMYKMLSKLGFDVRIVTSDTEEHAWNAVKLDNKYYLLDATWDLVDEETQEEDKYVYFLRGTNNFPSHDLNESTLLFSETDYLHTDSDYGSWSTRIAATCTTAGVEYRTCGKCRHEETREVGRLGHDALDDWMTDGGYHWHGCSRCDALVDKAEHNYGYWTVRNKATCTAAGVEYRKCKTCNHEETRNTVSLGHSYAEVWTKDGNYHWHKCTRCNVTDKKVKHEFESAVTQKPTYTAKGIRTYTCKECGYSYTEEIDKLTKSVAGITVKSTLTLEIGGYETLKATINPDDAADKRVTWYSSDSTIAAVESNGKVTGKKKGTATITVITKDGNKKATCKVTVKEAAKVAMHRLYNPNSGEHFYTGSEGEKNGLVKAGWVYEGIGWYAPKISKTPVYRLYDKNSGDHHYTMNKKERDWLISLGWNDEGIGWYSDDNKGIPLYRQYNPNAKTGSHNYTTSKKENDWLVSIGWIAEGIGWYGMR